MSKTDPTDAPPLATDRPLTLAILAMGGQGGGVLADWIVALAESQGYAVQATSVAGVAQRTGATIYYIEMLPERAGAHPVLSLMPTPGDVDVVMTAEFMETGRSVMRGLVTPDRTTVIASNHRALAVVEKERPGNGIGDSAIVDGALDVAARRIIAFDMQALAERHGSVISAAMFGALAASGVLPFPRQAFEATIRSGGKGIEASLATFAAAADTVGAAPRTPGAGPPAKQFAAIPAGTGEARLDRVLQRLKAAVPAAVQPMAYAGARKLVDFQDPDYALEYLDRLGHLAGLDRSAGGEARGYAFTLAAAKHLANAMAYDDVIRVADLKIRGSRFERVRREVGARTDQIVYTTEYMHPRMEEVAGSLPKALGLWLERRPALFGWLDRRVNRGRRVRTGTIRWFLALYLVAGMKPVRRRTLRHAREVEHRDAWLARAEALVGSDYALATGVLACRRLIKGYSDTHARGHGKFDRVMAALPRLAGREDGAVWLDRLVRAALLDEEGKALDGALKTVEAL